jgi:Flp pilus assembly protein CpaB
MEMDYQEPGRRGKIVVVVGIVLALFAGAAAFYLINQAQQTAGQAGLTKVSIVVATRQIPARKPIEAADVQVRDVPVDNTNSQGVFSDPAKIIGLIPGVTILQGQPIYANFLASQTQGGQFSILGPSEVVNAASPAWRAVSVTVPDDRAVAGMVAPDDTVDVFVTASVLVPEDLRILGRYYTDKSTKVVYQNVIVLAKSGNSYVIKVPETVAEEISHLQASGAAAFSFALRPGQDNRMVDASGLGETTNRIIQRYGLPVPEAFPPGRGPIPTAAPTPKPSPSTSPGPSSSP